MSRANETVTQRVLRAASRGKVSHLSDEKTFRAEIAAFARVCMKILQSRVSSYVPNATNKHGLEKTLRSGESPCLVQRPHTDLSLPVVRSFVSNSFYHDGHSHPRLRLQVSSSLLTSGNEFHTTESNDCVLPILRMAVRKVHPETLEDSDQHCKSCDFRCC